MGLSKNWKSWKHRIRRINIINKSDAIYLAGIFDGEGCVTLGKMENYKTTYCLNVNVTNTNQLLLEWIKETVGKGGVYKKTRENDYWKDNYVWKINGSLAVSFLKVIYPYLKVKRIQCDIAFKFGETIQGKQTRVRLTDEERDSRRELFLEMRKANHRNNGVLDGRYF